MDAETVRDLLSPAGQALLSELPAYDEGSALALGERLRREHPAALVAAALTQSRLRARATAKFGPAAADMLFTPEGLEQATRREVAAGHAERYLQAGVRTVADLCCGIGADARAFAAAGLGVLAADRDPATALVAGENLRSSPAAQVVRADVTRLPVGRAGGAFIDPSRRGARGRTFDPRSYSPPFGFVLDLAAQIPATGAKVAPGIPHDALPAGTETRWVSVAGDVVEAGVWFGPLATPDVRRSALLLREGAEPASVTDADGGGAQAPFGRPGRWLYEPDGAVIRAGLVAAVAAAVDGRLVDPTIAYVTADRLVPTKLATAYEVVEILPFGLKPLREALRARRASDVIVKKRGSAIEPETLRRQLKLTGDGPTVIVVVTRVAGRPTAMIVTRAV